MENDPLCIKEDVCDMAVCDGVSSCSHAVLKTAVLVQQTTNTASTPLPACITCAVPNCGMKAGYCGLYKPQ